MNRKIISKIRDLNLKGSGRLASFLSKILLPKPKGELIIKTIYGLQTFGLDKLD